MSQLSPCPNCHQHVRLTEARCPFCQTDLAGILPQPLPSSIAPEEEDSPTLYRAPTPPPPPDIESAALRVPDGFYMAPAYGGTRLAPKYGGPPIYRAARLLLLVGGVGITVYLIVHMVR